MNDLVICLAEGKGTWYEVKKIIQNFEWNKVFVITNNYLKDKVKDYLKGINNKKIISVDEKKDLDDMRDFIIQQIKDEISSLEVGINLLSGSGKIHMALLTALLKLGIGIRFVYINYDGKIDEL